MHSKPDGQVSLLRVSEPFGVERYDKFHDPIMIEPADCQLAAKTGRFKLNRKDYPFEMNLRRSVIVNLVGGLDNNGNCKVGLFEVNREPLKSRWHR
jgi:hypothetical protein